MRALIVDDEPQIRRALRAGLEQNGYQVTLATNGEEGLDQAALHPPDGVILDLASLSPEQRSKFVAIAHLRRGPGSRSAPAKP